MIKERCRYAASLLPMFRCVLEEGHEGSHTPVRPDGPLNLRDATEQSTVSKLQPRAHMFIGEPKSVPCKECGLIYSADVHHRAP